jgi:hypothetical protein
MLRPFRDSVFDSEVQSEAQRGALAAPVPRTTRIRPLRGALGEVRSVGAPARIRRRRLSSHGLACPGEDGIRLRLAQRLLSPRVARAPFSSSAGRHARNDQGHPSTSEGEGYSVQTPASGVR